MEMTYFDRCFAQRPKIRWICHFLRASRFIELEQLRDLINEKVARIEGRKGPLAEEIVLQIVENLLLAKVNRRFLDLRIKPFKLKSRHRSPMDLFRNHVGESLLDQVTCPLYKEHKFSLLNHPSILVPGFLPEGNDAFFLLRNQFLRHGSVYYVNYPSRRFHRELLFHQLYELILDINQRKLKRAGQRNTPFLVATSFGCSMVLAFLRWLKEMDFEKNIQLHGIILISPVLCLADVVDPTTTRQKTLVGRAISQLLEVDPEDPEAVAKAMGKARSIFLKMFTSGRDMLNFSSKDLIPVFAIEDQVLSVFDKEIGHESGYFHRYLELKRELPIESEFLTSVPTLVLLAEAEEDVLTPNSPTLKAFTDAKTFSKIFPNGSVEVVYSKDSQRKVTHSDLIFQANRFKEHLKPWMERLEG